MAAQRVETLHGALLEAMQRGGELEFDGRSEFLAPTLAICFDLPYMAQKAVGRYWRELDEAQQSRVVEAFTRMTVATYAGRFDAYEGQRFETIGQESSAYDTILVRTRIVPLREDPVELTYRLHETEAGWRIIDVFLKGTVSELALRRTEYASVIRRHGIAALIQALEDKATELEEESRALPAERTRD